MSVRSVFTVDCESKRELSLLRASASATAICMFALAAPAFAQTGPGAGQNTAGSTKKVDPNATNTPQTENPDAQVSEEPGQNGAPAVDDKGSGDVVVTGIRQSLANAQNIKRNSDTVVDAITATDIGALPDRSVTEALQRVPGVEISRFAAANDPDHFSVEGSGVVIRGLNFVRSEFNGRDAFAAGIGGNALNFSDVPSELLGSVEVYKNVTAAAIEGGLAGTVNLNTRKPFDNKGLHIAFDGEANYGDFEKKWSPTYSGLISDTWNTGIGQLGLLADVSYSRIRSRADGIQVTNYQTRDNTLVPYQSGNGVLVCRTQLPSSTDATSFPPNSPAQAGVNSGNPIPPACGASQVAGKDGLADPLSVAYAPLGGQFRTQEFDRKRQGIALAGQWESNDRSFLLTGQFIRSHTTNLSSEHTFESAPDLSEYSTYPRGCRGNQDGPLYNGNATSRADCRVDANGNFFFAANDLGNGVPLGANSYPNYTYDANGLFQKGYITLPGTGYRTNRSGTPSTTTIPTGGQQLTLDRDQTLDENTVNDFGLNAQINPTDRLSIALDADYTRSEHNNLSMQIYGSDFADQELDLTGNLPVVIPHKPTTLSAAWAGAPNPTLVSETDAQYFKDPNTEFWRSAMDHVEHSRGDEYQFKADVNYKLPDGSFIQRISFGARYADRNQNIDYSAYNWGQISEIWAGYPVTVGQAGQQNAEFYSFPDFYRGATPGPVGAYYYNGNLIDGYSQAVGFVQNIEAVARNANANTSQQWRPVYARDGVVPGTSFLPNEMSRINESDSSAYLMLPFRSESAFGRLNISGNIGVRFVYTDVKTFSSTAIPTYQTLGIARQNNSQLPQPYQTITNPDGSTIAGRCDVRSPPAGSPPGTPSSIPGGVCNLGQAGYNLLVQFAAAAPTYLPSHSDAAYHYFLPSFNLKVGVTPKLQFRVAASKVLTRPDTGYIRPNQQISIDGNGNFLSTVGNPYLKPATAWQFDLTGEWYFSKVGSLTADVFYKDVSNFFYQSVVNSTITNNNVNFSLLTRGPANYTGHGKIKGAEIAYQQTFDFLPWIFSGLGFQGNYSYIDSTGLPASFLNAGAATTNVGASSRAANLPLEGLSKHNFNATLFFEKGPISLRGAYNWRSKYLLTAADVIFPYSSIFQDAAGTLDASGFININKMFKIGVQGVNLTNTVTKTLQAYTADPNKLAPRSYFVNDRRFSFILRGQF